MWTCVECGNKERKWAGSCSACGQWNTLTEAGVSQGTRPVPLSEVELKSFRRLHTGIVEFDRLLGGGAALGSLTLIGGEPGVGKSTLTLQLAHRYAQQGLTVLYVSGEESAEQTSLRASRLKIQAKTLFVLAETELTHIKEQILHLKPDVLIVDSVQILYNKEIGATPGSVSQVKEVAMQMMHLSKAHNITTFLIGHVTKSGEIAGPRVLEHLVDTVFEFEGDRQSGYRMIRSIKNRFGPTDDIALFQMEAGGLVEVKNPSEALLEHRIRGASGSIITPTLEGTRPLLVEIQALVSVTSYSSPARRSSGYDLKRLSLVLAVLEKKLRFTLHSKDVFVSVTGGLKLNEPAADLAVACAIASSERGQSADPFIACVGEVGLSGEVRAVPRIEPRIKEAIHLGFKKLVLPNQNLKGIGKALSDKIALEGINHVGQAIALMGL